MGAIQKVFEDSGDRLENEHFQPLMMPILSFFSSPSAKMRFVHNRARILPIVLFVMSITFYTFRGLAMSSYNCILMVNNDPITPVIDDYLPQLFTRAHDTDEVCVTVSLLIWCHYYCCFIGGTTAIVPFTMSFAGRIYREDGSSSPKRHWLHHHQDRGNTSLLNRSVYSSNIIVT